MNPTRFRGLQNVSQQIPRRRFLSVTGRAGAGFWLGMGLAQTVVGAANAFKIRDVRIISQQPELYHGWPTLTRRKSGQLILVWSGGREDHVCPFGRVEWMRSEDQGESWSWPRVLLDGELDDRDAGVLETAGGSLLVTTFTSLAYESLLSGRKKDDPAWRAAHARLTAPQRQAELGQWMIRSTDGGLTWSTRYPSIVNSPHGPVSLSDGRLFYAGKELWTGQKRVGVCVSKDDGQTWQWLSEIPVRKGDRAEEYHELHAVETADGRILVQLRNHNRANEGETLQCESTDGGATWTTPRSIGVWGLPSFLLRLRDGRLLMTYGHRQPPYGNQARLSQDHGRTWLEPMIISGDGSGGDLGYPSTVQCDDGSLITVWYERMKDSPKAVLRQARWTL